MKTLCGRIRMKSNVLAAEKIPGYVHGCKTLKGFGVNASLQAQAFLSDK